MAGSVGDERRDITTGFGDPIPGALEGGERILELLPAEVQPAFQHPRRVQRPVQRHGKIHLLHRAVEIIDPQQLPGPLENARRGQQAEFPVGGLFLFDLLQGVERDAFAARDPHKRHHADRLAVVPRHGDSGAVDVAVTSK